MHSYFKYDTIFAADLYGIYNGLPCKSHTDWPLIILYLLLKMHTSFLWIIKRWELILQLVDLVSIEHKRIWQSIPFCAAFSSLYHQLVSFMATASQSVCGEMVSPLLRPLVPSHFYSLSKLAAFELDRF